MKSYVSLPVLAGLALAAPQVQPQAQQDIKPFKEPPANHRHCYISDERFPYNAPSRILSEDCAGTMAYCFQEYYKLPKNGENFANPGECLQSRGVDLSTVPQQIFNMDDFSAAIQGLYDANAWYNLYKITGKLEETLVDTINYDYDEPIIRNLVKERESFLQNSTHSLVTVKEKMQSATSSDFAAEVDREIQSAKEQLEQNWDKFLRINVNQIADVSQVMEQHRQDVRNQTTYDSVIRALRTANAMYNRRRLSGHILPIAYVDSDRYLDLSKMISSLSWGMQDMEYQADSALKKLSNDLKIAFSDNVAKQINVTVTTALDDLEKTWNEAADIPLQQVHNLYQWVRDHTQEKYRPTW